MIPGIYHLIIHLSSDTIIEVGKLGRYHFREGYYVYTGSAMRGLDQRIARHKRSDKRLHWHIDYLLKHAQIVDVITHITRERQECQFNRKIMSLPGCQIPINGFGSSDCNCTSHLTFFKEKPILY
jgi:sugar fermentation stimulation protein A